MGRAYSRQVGERGSTESLDGKKRRKKILLEDLNIDWKIILKWILRKLNGMVYHLGAPQNVTIFLSSHRPLASQGGFSSIGGT
jgi:hypothetical protein